MTLHWHIRDRVLDLSQRPLILGILNVTPDSFSDGGQHATASDAVAYGLTLLQQGADMLDIGGESTRPGSLPVPVDVELDRVLPVVVGLRQRTDAPLSVDTSKADVARRCLEAGADIINDVTALAGDAQMAQVVRDSGAGAILMHMQGTPATMHLAPHYDDVIAEIRNFFHDRLNALQCMGLAANKLVLDPGLGFGKTLDHNLAILARLDAFLQLGRPICLGVSRKGMLGQITGRPRDERATATALVGLYETLKDAAHIHRVHDVLATRDALRLAAALRHAEMKAAQVQSPTQG